MSLAASHKGKKRHMNIDGNDMCAFKCNLYASNIQ
jgi:hypothetical protein